MGVFSRKDIKALNSKKPLFFDKNIIFLVNTNRIRQIKVNFCNPLLNLISTKILSVERK